MQHQCKLHIVILEYDLLKDNEKFSKPVISSKTMKKNLYGKLWKTFSRMRKNRFKKYIQALTPRELFMFSMGNHVIRFQVQFGINLREWVFERAEIARAASASAISTFWRTHKCKLRSDWREKEAAWLLIKTRKKSRGGSAGRSMSNQAFFFFSLNLKLICTRDYFKKLKLQSQKMLVQFQLFEKLTRAN